MGRHKKMVAADTTPPPPQIGPRQEPREYAPAAISRVRRLTVRTLGAEERKARFERLCLLLIREPEGPLRAQAIVRGALVWAHTKYSPEAVDAKQARVVMRYLYAEAVIYQHVDEERALTREKIDRYLDERGHVSLPSQRLYRNTLYAAGRVLYPREFPAPQAVLAPRSKRTPAASPRAALELYALAPILPPGLRWRVLLILDLVTGAGLRAREIREIRGGDVSTCRLGPGHEIVVIRVRDRGTVDRVVPVIDARKGQRILDLAGAVGPDRTLLPAASRDGTVEKNAVNRVSEQLKRLGYPGVDFAALRNRWILDLASTPGIPAAALLRLAGVGDLQVLADQRKLLPDYGPEQLAGLLLRAEQVEEEVAA
ncbi:hypothetical protein Csp1_01220 [Corynebacterium provencense]|uniref:Tyr recombinase domain-containing protein n=1 Tax=Corynebacterium provencense TaxID=1737425 RepID=A0A2Z3YPX2_9CORY|nr:hypothetical protein [Corynebacterium provencense]AWT24950.1 hypothetical protein Csp1_01220 [Corynebacterium provencense]